MFKLYCKHRILEKCNTKTITNFSFELTRFKSQSVNRGNKLDKLCKNVYNNKCNKTINSCNNKKAVAKIIY